MNRELTDGLTVKEAISHVNACLEERDKQRNKRVDITVPGFLWTGCEYNKVL